MPNLLAHRLFAERLDQNLLTNPDAKKALLYGTQGPDPMFYYGIMPFHQWHYLRALKRYGNKIHKTDGKIFFTVLIDEYKTIQDENEKEVFGAFIIGQLAHYYLDCYAHPYVYYMSGFTDEGHIKGKYHYEHANFESEIDSCLADIYESIDFRDDIAKAMPVDKKVLKIIDKHLPKAMSKMFFEKFGNNYYTNSWINMRAMQKMANKKFWRFIAGKKSMFNAIFTSDDYSEDPLNLKHNVWHHPVSNEESTLSFLDLFNKALQDLKPVYEKFLNDGIDENLILSSLKELDYRGVPVDSQLKYKLNTKENTEENENA